MATALAVRAANYIGGSPTANQLAWAKSILADMGTNSVSQAQVYLNYLLGANPSLTVAQFTTTVTDAQIQTAVDAIVAKITA